MKKLLSAAIIVVLVALSSTSAFAHGSRHSAKRAVSYSYSVCAVQSCTLTGLHTHNGGTYSAHYYGDGHDYHDYCGIEDCATVGYHSHDGVYCFGHTYNDGHDYHGYCDLADCTLTGYHGHNGAYCFGHTANDGHSYHRSSRNHH